MPGAKVNLSHLLKYTSMATCLFTVVTPHIGDPLSLTTFNAKIGDPTRANSGPTLIEYVRSFLQLLFLILSSGTHNKDFRLIEIEALYQENKSWL